MEISTMENIRQICEMEKVDLSNLNAAILKGKFKYSETEIYEGEFSRGKRHGFGKLVCMHKINKTGKYTFKLGGSYEGQYENDYRHGKGKSLNFVIFNKFIEGIFVYENGERYEGDFYHDRIQGNGMEMLFFLENEEFRWIIII